MSLQNQKKQYGLIKPKQANVPLKRPSIFEEDEESDEGADMSSTDWIKKSYQKEAEKNYQKRAVKTQLDKALEDDPSVFQYDELYDDMQSKKSETIKAKKDVDRKPRYIQSLLAQAERRKRENEYRNERVIQKEREAEGEQFKDKETFVTSAYRKKLEEFKKMDEQERRQDMLEEIGDVTKQKDLSGFYRHLYQSTVSNDEKKVKSEVSEENIKLCKSPNSPDDRSEKDLEIKKEDETESFPISKTTSKARFYRKRKSSSSGDEVEEKPTVEIRKKRRSRSSEEDVNRNLDADTDISSSSSGSSSSSSSSSSSESDAEPEANDVQKPNDADLTSGSEEGEIIEASEKRSKKVSKKVDAGINSNSQPEEDSVPKEKVKQKTETNREKDQDKKRKKEDFELVKNDKKDSDHEKEEEEDKVEVEEEVEKKNIWEKRTVGAVFDEALKRYLERKSLRSSG